MRALRRRLRRFIRSLRSRTLVHENRILFRRKSDDLSNYLKQLGEGTWSGNRHISVATELGVNVLRRVGISERPARVVAGVYGDFGNQVLEALCAVQTAKKLGIGEVLLEKAGVFRAGQFFVSGTRLVVPEEPLDRASVGEIVQSFLRPSSKAFDLYGAYLLNWIEAPFSLPDSESILEDLRGLMSADLSGEPHSRNELTVSFRGGDAFSANPPSHYGQPPLSYYKKIALKEKWDRIYVVSDDLANPALGAFLSWAEDEQLLCLYQPQSWKADVNLVFRSRNVVAPRGSFVPSVCALSPFTEKMWHFESANLPIPQGFVRKVADRSGEYSSEIAAGAWFASEEQIRFMLEYPIDRLEEQKT